MARAHYAGTAATHCVFMQQGWLPTIVHVNCGWEQQESAAPTQGSTHAWSLDPLVRGGISIITWRRRSQSPPGRQGWHALIGREAMLLGLLHAKHNATKHVGGGSRTQRCQISSHRLLRLFCGNLSSLLPALELAADVKRVNHVRRCKPRGKGGHGAAHTYMNRRAMGNHRPNCLSTPLAHRLPSLILQVLGPLLWQYIFARHCRGRAGEGLGPRTNVRSEQRSRHSQVDGASDGGLSGKHSAPKQHLQSAPSCTSEHTYRACARSLGRTPAAHFVLLCCSLAFRPPTSAITALPCTFDD